METQDVPTTKELYQREVRSLPRFTLAEEQELVRRARRGDADARTALIQSCLNYVGFMAAWHVRYVFHDEYLDLVGIGNVAVVEHVDEALTRENPCAYLRGCAKFAIIYYCFNRASLIPTPWQAKQSISVAYQDVLIKHYGLYDRPPESLYALSRRTNANVKGSVAYLTEYRALRRLRKHLTKGGTNHPEALNS